MTILGETRRVPADSKHAIHGRKKSFLLLKCDLCGIEFERGTGNLSALRKRPRHFCTSTCHKESMKSGGKSDESRKSTCRQKYGVDYYINLFEVASRASKMGHTPEHEERRKIQNKKNMEDYSIRLRRGLTLCRSKAEIDFLAKLACELEDVLLYQEYINGWWIDAYSPKYDCWIQFDGEYWHSRPKNVERDTHQNEWFKASGLRLVRITDKQAKLSDSVKKISEQIRSFHVI